MEAAVFSLAYLGFVLISLAADGPHRHVIEPRPGPTARRLLGALGWVVLAGSLAAAVARLGWGLGSLEWVCALGVCAMVLVLLLSDRPRIALYLAVAAAAVTPPLLLAG